VIGWKKKKGGSKFIITKFHNKEIIYNLENYEIIELKDDYIEFHYSNKISEISFDNPGLAMDCFNEIYKILSN